MLKQGSPQIGHHPLSHHLQAVDLTPGQQRLKQQQQQKQGRRACQQIQPTGGNGMVNGIFQQQRLSQTTECGQRQQQQNPPTARR